jgi:hypothetical protein
VPAKPEHRRRPLECHCRCVTDCVPIAFVVSVLDPCSVPRDHVISSDEATAKLAWTRTLKFFNAAQERRFSCCSGVDTCDVYCTESVAVGDGGKLKLARRLKAGDQSRSGKQCGQPRGCFIFGDAKTLFSRITTRMMPITTCEEVLKAMQTFDTDSRGERTIAKWADSLVPPKSVKGPVQSKK